MKRYYTLTENLEYKDCTLELRHSYRTQKLHKYYFICLFIISLVLYISIEHKYENQLNKIKSKESLLESQIKLLQSSNENKYNLKSVEKYIDYLPFKNKEFVKKQMRLESANTLSSVARSHNNLFGMKNAGKRFQYGIKGIDYRNYQHWTLSVIDRLEWERNGGNIKTYAQDINYLNKLK